MPLIRLGSGMFVELGDTLLVIAMTRVLMA